MSVVSGQDHAQQDEEAPFLRPEVEFSGAHLELPIASEAKGIEIDNGRETETMSRSWNDRGAMVDAITLAPRGTTWPETTRSNRHRSQSERPHVRQSNGYPRDVAQEGNRSNSQVLPGTHYYRPRNVGDRESKIHKKHLEYISQLERAKILAVGERDRLSRDVYEKELLCQKLQKDIHEYKQSIPLSARFDADVLDHVIRARLDKLYRKSMDWAVKTARFMNAETQDTAQGQPTWTDFLQQQVPCTLRNPRDNLKYVLVAILGESWVNYFKIKYYFGDSHDEHVDAATKLFRLFGLPAIQQSSESVASEKRRWLNLTTRLLNEVAEDELRNSRNLLISKICEAIKSTILANTSFMINEIMLKNLRGLVHDGLSTLQILHAQRAQYSLVMLKVSDGPYQPLMMEDMGGEDEARLHGMPLQACLFPILTRHVGPALDMTEEGWDPDMCDVVFRAKVLVASMAEELAAEEPSGVP